MSNSPPTHLEQVRTAMAALEAQRALLGEAVVETALAGLRQQLAALEAAAAAAPEPLEERRLLTILFIDIVGSTALAEQLDPEEWRQTVAGFHASAGAAITAQGGSVAQYLGDGQLAFFGAQQASERDPENAVRAALDLQAAVAALPAVGRDAARLQARAGVHTGPVVIGELGPEGHKEFTATGDAMNLAARLQAAAPAGGVLMSHDTYRHVRGVFTVTPRPPLVVKGKRDPVQTYLVRRAKPRAFRTVTRGVMGLETRTVGREAELDRLHAGFVEALERRQTVWVQVVGEPGIGKSRLVEDMHEWLDLRPETMRVLRARAFSDDAGQPFALIRRMWFDRFLIADDTPLALAEARWVKGYQELAQTEQIEPAQALGRLVGLPFHEPAAGVAAPGSTEAVRGRAFVVSRELIRAMRAQGPVAVLLEDLHWADAASWEWLTHVLAQAQPGLAEAEASQAHGLFVVASARPNWQAGVSAPLSEAEHFRYVQIDLAPLGEAASQDLARELLRGVEGVPEDVLQAIVERSEGVPYFAEELVNWFIDRGIIDRGAEPWQFVPTRLPEAPLPATLQHLLLTRLGALAPAERAALQRGAIFGRHFWTGGVEALGVAQGREVLGRLQPRGFVHAQPDSAFEGEMEWSFHHALLREVTYESVLKRERAALHRAAAGWLEEQAVRAERVDEFAGLLAEHAERAGELDAAAGWYLRAGARSAAQGAAREAKRSYDRALELTPPVERERRWQALLGREAADAFLGDPQARRANLEALLELAQDFDDPERLAEAYHRQADFLRQSGDNRAAVMAAEAATAAARRAGNAALAAEALAVKAQAEMRLYDLDSGLRDAEEALTLARALGDDATLALVLQRAAFCYENSDPARGIALQTEQIELARRLGAHHLPSGLANLGVGYRHLGLDRQARTALEQALELAEAFGARRIVAYCHMNLGHIAWRMDDLRSARRLLERAVAEMIAVADITGRVVSMFNLGYVLMDLGDAAGAARRFTECRDLSVSTGHVVGELLSSLALARSILALGRLDEARQIALQTWQKAEPDWRARPFGNQGLAYWTLAELFDALDEPDLERAVIEMGYQKLMEAANKISNPEWRRSFLESHHDNRKLVLLWERLQ